MEDGHVVGQEGFARRGGPCAGFAGSGRVLLAAAGEAKP